jgi:uncharacterized membrane protein
MPTLAFGLRWLHVFAAAIWLGMLYFLDFVRTPARAALGPDARKGFDEKVLPRALWWLKWSATLALAAGAALFASIYLYTPGFGWGPNALMQGVEGGLADRARWLMWGMMLGAVLWVDVWFLIVPMERRLLRGQAGGLEASLRRRADVCLRVGTYLTGPILVGMLGANHANMGFSYLHFGVAAALSLAAVWAAVFHIDKVGRKA